MLKGAKNIIFGKIKFLNSDSRKNAEALLQFVLRIKPRNKDFSF